RGRRIGAPAGAGSVPPGPLCPHARPLAAALLSLRRALSADGGRGPPREAESAPTDRRSRAQRDAADPRRRAEGASIAADLGAGRPSGTGDSSPDWRSPERGFVTRGRARANRQKPYRPAEWAPRGLEAIRARGSLPDPALGRGEASLRIRPDFSPPSPGDVEG